MLVKSNKLPMIPKPGTLVSAEKILRLEEFAINELDTVRDIDTAKSMLNDLAALEAYLRGKELQRPVLGAERRFEARIGQLLGPPIEGRPDNFHRDGSLANSLISNHTDRENFRLLARALEGKEAKKCGLTVDEWRKSRRALVALIRLRLNLMPIAPDFPEGKFSCLVVDPPWQQETGPEVFHGTGERGHDALTYSQLSIEKITAFADKSGRSIADCAADDCHLYLWTINKYLESSYAIARAWGFKPSVLLTWCKDPRGIGLGDTFRLTTEFILFCRRGSLQHKQIIPTTWFNWKRGKHSAKPDAFYEMIESVTPSTPATRLDIFARKKRDGWQAWGNEVEE